MQQSALLLIEFQQEWLSPKGKLHHLFADRGQFLSSLDNAERIIMAARQRSIPIIHSGLVFSPDYKELGSVNHGVRGAIASHQTFQMGTKGSEFSLPFIPRDNEFIVQGRLGSSVFAGSNLDGLLRSNSIRTLYLMGYALHVCVESTLRAAHDLGYECVVIEDATAAFSQRQKEHVLNEIIHHFGRKITTREYLTLIREKANEHK